MGSGASIRSGFYLLHSSKAIYKSLVCMNAKDKT